MSYRMAKNIIMCLSGLVALVLIGSLYWFTNYDLRALGKWILWFSGIAAMWLLNSILSGSCIGGQIIITDPDGTQHDPIELEPFGSWVTIGSKGQIYLDPASDPDVVGVVGKIKARQAGNDQIVRGLWTRDSGGQMREKQILFHKDTFYIGGFQVLYENLEAQREQDETGGA